MSVCTGVFFFFVFLIGLLDFCFFETDTMPPRRRVARAAPFAQARPYDALQTRQKYKKQFEERVQNDLSHSKFLGRSKALQYTPGLLIPQQLREVAFRAETDALTYAPRRHWFYTLGKKISLNQAAQEKNENYFQTMAWNALLQQSSKKTYTLFDFANSNNLPSLSTIEALQQPTFTANVLTVQEERRRGIDREIRLVEQRRMVDGVRQGGVDAIRDVRLNELQRTLQQVRDDINRTVNQNERRQTELRERIQDLQRQRARDRDDYEQTLGNVRRDLQEKRNLANNLTVEHIHLAKQLEDVLTDSERTLQHLDDEYKDEFTARITTMVQQLRDPSGQGRDIQPGDPLWQALYNVAQYHPFTAQYQQAYRALYQEILNHIQQNVVGDARRADIAVRNQRNIVQRLENELKPLRQRRDSAVTRLQQELDRITEEAKKKDDVIQQHRKDEQSLQRRLSELEGNYNRLQAEQKGITEERGMITALRTQNQQYEKDLKECEGLMEGLLRELPMAIQDQHHSQKRVRPSRGTPMLNPRDILKDIQTLIRDKPMDQEQIRRLSQQLTDMRAQFEERQAKQQNDWKMRENELQERARNEQAEIQRQLNLSEAELKTEIERHQSYKTQAESQLRELNTQITKLRETNQKFLEQTNEQQRQRENASTGSQILERQVRDQQTRLQQLDQELREKQREAKQLEEKYNETQVSANQAQQQLETTQNSLRVANQNIASLQIELDRLRADVPGERERRETVQEQLERERLRFQNLENDFKKLQQVNQNLREQHDQCLERREELQRQFQESVAQKQRLQENLAQVHEELQANQKQAEEHKTDLLEQQARLEAQAVAIAEHLAVREQLQSANEVLKGREEALKNDLEDSIAQVAALTNTLEEKQSDIERLREQVRLNEQRAMETDLPPEDEKMDSPAITVENVFERVRELLIANDAGLQNLIREHSRAYKELKQQYDQEIEEGRLRGNEQIRTKEDLERRKQEVQDFVRQNATLQDELRAKVQEIEMIRNAEVQCREERAQFEKLLNEKDIQIRDQQQHIEQLKGEIRSQQDNRVVQAQNEQFRQALQERQVEFENLQEQHQQAQRRLREIGQEVRQLEEKLQGTEARSREELEQCVGQYNERIQQLERQLQQQSDNDQKQIDLISTLNRLHREGEDEAANLAQTVGRLKEKLEQRKREQAEMVQHSSLLVTQLRGAEDRAQDLQHRFDGLQQRIVHGVEEARANEYAFRQQLERAEQRLAEQLQQYENAMNEQRKAHIRQLDNIRREANFALGEGDGMGNMDEDILQMAKQLDRKEIIARDDGSITPYNLQDFRKSLQRTKRAAIEPLRRHLRHKIPREVAPPDTGELQRLVQQDDIIPADLLEQKGQAPTTNPQANRPMFNRNIQQHEGLVRAAERDAHLVQRLQQSQGNMNDFSFQGFQNYQLNTNYGPIADYVQQQREKRRNMSKPKRSRVSRASQARIAQMFR